MLPLSNFSRPSTQRLTQSLIVGQSHDRCSQLIDVSGVNEQRRITIRQHLADLSETTRDNPFSHRHVLKNLRRRSEELATISKRHMRRDEYVASIEQTRHAIVAYCAREDHTPRRDFIFESLLDLTVQAAASYQQKPQRHIERNHFDGRGKLLDTMPWTKRPDKTRHDLIVSNTKLTPSLRPADARSKALHVNAIRIDDDLIRRDAARLEVSSLDVRNDKNTRRSVKVQSLVSLQQIETAHAVPVPAHPNFRTVVFEKQRALRAVRGHNTGPAKPRVPLIDEIGIDLLNQRRRATCENKIVMNLEKCARAAAGLRRNHREAIFRGVETRNEVVADDLHFDAERFESFNNALDVTRSAARLCAWSRRRAEVNNTQT